MGAKSKGSRNRHTRKMERRKLIRGLRKDPRGGYTYKKQGR